MVRQLIIFISLLIPLLGYSQTYNVEKLPYTGDGDMYAATYFQNKLVVCSNKKNDINKTVIDISDKETINLYIISYRNGDSISSFAESIRTNYNDGPLSFNQKGTEFVVSKNLNSKDDQNKKDDLNIQNQLGLFWYSIDSLNIKLISALPFNSDVYNCSHPTLSSNGKVLYFSSNMPGGFGGIDIWKSEQLNGVWGIPENLGKTINSDGNELFPSIIDDFLYFSSNRDEFGGLDLYRCNISLSDQNSTVLPAPINSKYDDFAPISKNNFNSGYFSSNRSGEDRIYKFEPNFPEFTNCDSLKATYFCYEFHENSEPEILANNPVIHRWRINNEVIDGESIEYCFPSVGQYEVFLDVIDPVFKQTYTDQSYFFIDIQNEIQPYITSKDIVLQNESFTLSAKDTYLPNVEIKDYYWIIDDEPVFKGMATTYSFIDQGNHIIKLGVIDTAGNKYCVFKTVYCRERFKEIKYLNTTNKKLNDTTNLCYRIEAYRSKDKLNPDSNIYKKLSTNDNFMVKYLEKEDSFVYLIGKWDDANEARSASSEMKNNNDSLKLILRSLKPEKYKFNEKFVLNSFRFDANSSILTKTAYKELNELVELLESHPNTISQINAYTDNLGSSRAKLKVSIKRAEIIKKYFIDKGIHEKRIIAKGFGGQDPIESNSTGIGRQLNRRIEIIIKD